MTKPRPTKIAKVQSLLQRPSGATIAALCKATGWQAHSVRAALTGLRKAGHVIDRSEGDAKTGASVYRIIAMSGASS